MLYEDDLAKIEAIARKVAKEEAAKAVEKLSGDLRKEAQKAKPFQKKDGK